jgi:hypothetical protein
MKNIKDIFVTYGTPLILILAGVVLGYELNEPENPKKSVKQYPIEVSTRWAWNGLGGGSSMECDSVVGDTIWKDGIKLVSKNIIEVKFK